MTIEEEIRQRLRTMGLDEESVGPCMAHIKDDPLCRSISGLWRHRANMYQEVTVESFWLAAKSSALDYLEKKYAETAQHILNAVSLMETRKSPVTMNNDGEEERTCLNE